MWMTKNCWRDWSRSYWRNQIVSLKTKNWELKINICLLGASWWCDWISFIVLPNLQQKLRMQMAEIGDWILWEWHLQGNDMVLFLFWANNSDNISLIDLHGFMKFLSSIRLIWLADPIPNIGKNMMEWSWDCGRPICSTECDNCPSKGKLEVVAVKLANYWLNY
jgi:hypothetical protein